MLYVFPRFPSPSLGLHLRLLKRILILLQNPLLNQRLRIRPTLQPILQAISPHMTLELLLMPLQRGCSARIGQDVALDEGVAVRALLEALFEVVGCALALEFKGFGLEGAV